MKCLKKVGHLTVFHYSSSLRLEENTTLLTVV